MHNRDNYQYGVYFQNVARSTLLIYHSDYYSERKITRMLSNANFSSYDFNVWAFFGKTTENQSMLDIVDELNEERFTKETFDGNTEIKSV